jgi:hypothetical protein
MIATPFIYHSIFDKDQNKRKDIVQLYGIYKKKLMSLSKGHELALMRYHPNWPKDPLIPRTNMRAPMITGGVPVGHYSIARTIAQICAIGCHFAATLISPFGLSATLLQSHHLQLSVGTVSSLLF